MQSRYTHHGLLWVDLESPTVEEIRDIVHEFGIERHIAEELLLPSGKPRAEFYDHYMYTIFHFPALRHSHKTREQEIDFIVGTRFIITAHHEPIDPLHKFTKLFEVHSIVNDGGLGDHAGFLFFYIMKKLYGAVEHEVEYIRRDLAQIEEHVFAGHESAMVSGISHSARDLLNLRQIIEPHREMLHEIEQGGGKFFGEDFVQYLRGLSNEYYRVHNHIMRETESLHELRETNNSLLTTKQNETMKLFTILAFVTFPLSLITAVFDMNLADNPIASTPNGFWIVVGIMAIVSAIMFWYFRHRKWL